MVGTQSDGAEETVRRVGHRRKPPRVRQADVVDDQTGKIHDARDDANPTLSCGRKPAPGTAQVYVYANGRDGQVIADVVRLDKGHTEGLEPRVIRARGHVPSR